MLTIHFDPCDGITTATLSIVCHRYNLMDEIHRIRRWGGQVLSISAR